MKHMQTTASLRLGRGRLLPLVMGGLALGAAVLTSGSFAQNNDNGGILPGKGSGSSTASTYDAVLAVDGQLEAEYTNSEMPVLHVHHEGLAGVGIAVGVSAEDAEFTSSGTLVAEVVTGGGVSLQGDGRLNPEIGLELTMHAATWSVARSALLIGSPAAQPLQAVLDGTVAPIAVVPMGDLASLDLEVFHQLLQKHASLPLRVTVVFVSVDGSGQQQLGAVSGIAGGTELDLAFQ